MGCVDILFRNVRNALKGIATPVASSLITIASALLLTDFRKIGRTVERLGLEDPAKYVS